MSAFDEDALENKLKESDLLLVFAKERKGKKEATKKPAGKVKRGHLVEFCTGMIPMLAAGIPLVECIEAMAEEVQSPALRQALSEIKIDIESGNNLSDAMQSHAKAFPDVMINLIRAGEFSGSLVESFTELRDYFIWLSNLRSDVKQATIYPAMVITAALGFIMLLFTFVVPRFAELLTSLNIPLPMPTQVVMDIGMFMDQYWLWVLLTPPVVWLILRYARRYSPKVAFALETIKFKIPVFGELNRMITMSRMTRNLGIMYKVGIPILESIDYCRGLVGSFIVSSALNQIKQDIADGSTIANAFRQHAIFPPMVLRMIAVGESTGNLDETLGHISTHYNEEIPRRIKRVFSIIEPTIILLLVGVVGFVALAIFLPMLTMMSAIG
ncbi:type II secretion system F family protein [Mariprofundus micogutta]|nr:type II secretion system F family protein [Mariprofundus micogutta]